MSYTSDFAVYPSNISYFPSTCNYFINKDYFKHPTNSKFVLIQDATHFVMPNSVYSDKTFLSVFFTYTWYLLLTYKINTNVKFTLIFIYVLRYFNKKNNQVPISDPEFGIV